MKLKRKRNLHRLEKLINIFPTLWPFSSASLSLTMLIIILWQSYLRTSLFLWNFALLTSLVNELSNENELIFSNYAYGLWTMKYKSQAWAGKSFNIRTQKKHTGGGNKNFISKKSMNLAKKKYNKQKTLRKKNETKCKKENKERKKNTF